jgi:hypothetical protein
MNEQRCRTIIKIGNWNPKRKRMNGVEKILEEIMTENFS